METGVNPARGFIAPYLPVGDDESRDITGRLLSTTACLRLHNPAGALSGAPSMRGRETSWLTPRQAARDRTVLTLINKESSEAMAVIRCNPRIFSERIAHPAVRAFAREQIWRHSGRRGRASHDGLWKPTSPVEEVKRKSRKNGRFAFPLPVRPWSRCVPDASASTLKVPGQHLADWRIVLYPPECFRANQRAFPDNVNVYIAIATK